MAFGRTDNHHIYLIAVTFFAMSGVALGILVSEGKIIIEQPYLDEYTECSFELNKCQESKITQCGPCVCKEGARGIMWTIMGIIFGIAGYVLYVVALIKADKLRENKDSNQKKPKKSE